MVCVVFFFLSKETRDARKEMPQERVPELVRLRKDWTRLLQVAGQEGNLKNKSRNKEMIFGREQEME